MPFNKPNLSPSPELSYLIGVLLGDGSLIHYERHSLYGICLYAKHKGFVEKFSRVLSIVMERGKPYFVALRKDGLYYSAGYSKLLFYFLNDEDNQRRVIELYPIHFIKGFWDSEGSITINTDGGVLVKLSNSNLKLLQKIQEMLKQLSVESSIHISVRNGTRIYSKLRKKFYTTKKNHYALYILRRSCPRFLKLMGD